MHIPSELTPEQLAYWENADGVFDAERIVMKAPAGQEDHVTDCVAVNTVVQMGEHMVRVVRVPWKPSEIDLAALAKGGTLWLSTWGGLPPHQLEVQAPE